MLTLLQGISKANSALLGDSSIDQSLQNTIEALGNSTNVDRCYIFTNRTDEDGVLRLYYTHEWCKKGIEVQLGNPSLSGISYEDLPGIYINLMSDIPFYGLVKDNENLLFREIMESQDIQAYLFTPILCMGEFWGWIGYDECHFERIWSNEEAEALFAVARNIGIRLQREEAEEKFRKTKKHFDLTIQGSQQGQWDFDLITNKVNFSQLYMSMLGYEQFEFQHTFENWELRLHPEDHNNVIKILKAYLNGDSPNYATEYRIKHKNGKYIWIRGSGVAERDEAGKPIFMVGSHLDITELKEQQLATEIQRNEYDTVINNLGETVFRLDQNRKFTFLNNFWKIVSGFDKTESLNRKLTDYIFADDIKYTNNSLDKMKEGAFIFEVRLRQKSGKVIWVQIIARDTSDIPFEDITITGSIININEYKEAEYRKKELIDMKTDFVAMASHQFRTPLTVIHSNLELLETYAQMVDVNIASKLENLTNRMKGEVSRLTHLMNNILVFGRNNINQPTLNSKPTILSKLVFSIIENYFSNQPDGRQVVIKGYISDRKFEIDELLFTYVLTNVLTNAFKYSLGKQNPEVNISYDTNAATIKICDFGIGIPKDEINQLFNSFFRASNTSTITGSGLGLVIAKQLMELHGGEIYVESVCGKGTIVTLTLYDQNNPSPTSRG